MSALRKVEERIVDAREPRASWLMPKLEARLWWCGDSVCDCRQPQIDRIEPNTTAGYPWIRRFEVWRGTFHGEGEGIREMLAELEAAAEQPRKTVSRLTPSTTERRT